MRGIEITTRYYEITLTDKLSGKRITVTLSDDHAKWIVKADGFQGYYKDLDTAMKESFKLMQSKLGRRFE